MAVATNTLLNDLAARGLLNQMTGDDALHEHLNQNMVTLYCGFDPTADSLHIGSLVPLLTLKRFQQAGHKPIALVGGATGLIGDPSFKAQERQLNTADVVANWVDRIREQVSQFINFDDTDNAAEVVNNLDWTQNISVLDFLRDVGKHFSVNNMINKESVKQRIEREGAGISFTEFSYMLLQSFDFAELYQRHNCTLQIGGSDQWGNITGGIDLARRMHRGSVYGLTLPLVTKSDGTKFGKTESGTIWLDSKKTSPYAFYQFWLNTADADVYKFLKYFTFLSVDEIDAIEAEDQAREGRPQAQSVLAEEVTRLVHGDEALVAAKRITQALFSGDLAELSADDFAQLAQDGMPSSELSDSDLDGQTVIGVLVDAGMANSGKQVKDALGRSAVLVNGNVVDASQNPDPAGLFCAANAKHDCYFMVKLGKKKHHLFKRV
ncbi:MAG: tyrosine--tRNA ligase [Gammaproteobacteria bacterium]|nr:tyrosine--tRNA ligase [Gammaproteobacteria bacterium]